jgi:hypothetical protein
MVRYLITLIPILLLLSLRLSAQSDSTRYKVFSGQIIDDSLGYALPSVHLWNESTRMGAISNESGEFSIHVKEQDTVVFSILGYESFVYVVSSLMPQKEKVRLRQRKYEIDELVVRRFRNYASFKYHVLNLDLPESQTAQLKSHLQVASMDVAIEADRERAIQDKLETGRIGYITPLGKGVNRENAFKNRMTAREKREKVIQSKFNRTLVGDISHLEGDELTEFIAMCNFSEEYLYETDLYTIIELLYVKLEEYHAIRDTIPSQN